MHLHPINKQLIVTKIQQSGEVIHLEEYST